MLFKSVCELCVAKYLGLLNDEKLKFDDHFKHICKKLSLICGIILLSSTLHLLENPSNVVL